MWQNVQVMQVLPSDMRGYPALGRSSVHHSVNYKNYRVCYYHTIRVWIHVWQVKCACAPQVGKIIKRKKEKKQTLKPGEDRHYKSKANAQNYINFANNLLLKNTVDSHYIDIMLSKIVLKNMVPENNYLFLLKTLFLIVIGCVLIL